MSDQKPKITLTPRMPLSEQDALQRLKAQRARPVYKPVRHISRGLKSVTKNILKSEGPGLALLQARWKDLAGERLASISKPIKLSGKKDELTLTLSISRAAAPLFQHQSESLRKKLSLQLGGNLSSIKLVHDASGNKAKRTEFQQPLSAIDQRELENGVSDINNKQLSDALLAFGKAVYTQK